MRRRLAVPVVAAFGAALWFWFLPDPPPDGMPARFSAAVSFPAEAAWVGGLSGIDVGADGRLFHVVADRGHRATGFFRRENGTLTGIEVSHYQPIQDRFGNIQDFPHTDAEGIAIDDDGRVYISFEHAHRVLVYDGWDTPARWPSYTRAWRALSQNKGLEALAIAGDGTLFAIPELVNPGAWESLVYSRPPGGAWDQRYTLPVDGEFSPVGADFGPDGRFYVLERAFYPPGFYSRVRAMQITESEFADIETVFQSKPGAHGNLEGLAVWQDGNGAMRLTMISDDNFQFFMRSEVVEYVLDGRVAKIAD